MLSLIKKLRLMIKGISYEEEVTQFVNSKDFKSDTSFFIYVDTKNFKTNIFKGSTKVWILIKSYDCSIGKPSTPTPKGDFKIGVKGLYFGVKRGYKCWYYTQFYEDYLFHSIVYNLDGSIRDGRLKKEISNGCVRLLKEDAKWIWDNIPKNTFVTII